MSLQGYAGFVETVFDGPDEPEVDTSSLVVSANNFKDLSVTVESFFFCLRFFPTPFPTYSDSFNRIISSRRQ